LISKEAFRRAQVNVAFNEQANSKKITAECSKYIANILKFDFQFSKHNFKNGILEYTFDAAMDYETSKLQLALTEPVGSAASALDVWF